MLKTGHSQMVPLMFYAGIKFVGTQKVKYFYLFACAFVYQFYIGIYVGFFSILAFIGSLPLIIIYFKNNNLVFTHFLNKLPHLSLVGVLSVVALAALFLPLL